MGSQTKMSLRDSPCIETEVYGNQIVPVDKYQIASLVTSSTPETSYVCHLSV